MLLKAFDARGFLPRKLYFQGDNASINKCKPLFAFCHRLVELGIFDEIYLGYLLVGHTHEDIDQHFSLLSKYMLDRSACTPEDFVKLITDCYANQRLPHEVITLRTKYAYKAWLETTVDPKLRKYSKVHQMWFRKAVAGTNAGKVVMSYKLRSREPQWRDEIVVCPFQPTQQCPTLAACDSKWQLGKTEECVLQALAVACVGAKTGDEQKWQGFFQMVKTPATAIKFVLPKAQNPLQAADGIAVDEDDEADSASSGPRPRVVEHAGNEHGERDPQAAPDKKKILILTAPITTLPKGSFVVVRADPNAVSPFWLGKVLDRVTASASTFQVQWYTGASGEGSLNGGWRKASEEVETRVTNKRGKRGGKKKKVKKLLKDFIRKDTVILHHIHLPDEPKTVLPKLIRRALASIEQANVRINENDHLSRDRAPTGPRPADGSDAERHDNSVSSDDEPLAPKKKKGKKRKGEDGGDDDDDDDDDDEEAAEASGSEEEDEQKGEKEKNRSSRAGSRAPPPVMPPASAAPAAALPPSRDAAASVADPVVPPAPAVAAALPPSRAAVASVADEGEEEKPQRSDRDKRAAARRSRAEADAAAPARPAAVVASVGPVSAPNALAYPVLPTSAPVQHAAADPAPAPSAAPPSVAPLAPPSNNLSPAHRELLRLEGLPDPAPAPSVRAKTASSKPPHASRAPVVPVRRDDLSATKPIRRDASISSAAPSLFSSDEESLARVSARAMSSSGAAGGAAAAVAARAINESASHKRKPAAPDPDTRSCKKPRKSKATQEDRDQADDEEEDDQSGEEETHECPDPDSDEELMIGPSDEDEEVDDLNDSDYGESDEEEPVKERPDKRSRRDGAK